MKKILFVLFVFVLALAACQPAPAQVIVVENDITTNVEVDAGAGVVVVVEPTQAPTPTLPPTATPLPPTTTPLPPTETPAPTETPTPEPTDTGRICPPGDSRLVWGAPDDNGIMAEGQRQQIGFAVQQYLDGEITIDELVFPIQQDALTTCAWTQEAHDIVIDDPNTAHLIWCSAPWGSVPADAGDPVFTTTDGGSLYIYGPDKTGVFEDCGPDNYLAWATQIK